MITTKKEIESPDIKDKSYSRGCGKGLVFHIEPKKKVVVSLLEKP